MTEGIGLQGLVVETLEDFKAVDVRVLDVRSLTTITDSMVVASGTSDRHVRALADKVVETAKQNDIVPVGVEGHTEGEWVLVDLGEVIVHLMQRRTRDFYNLEKLWDMASYGKPQGAIND